MWRTRWLSHGGHRRVAIDWIHHSKNFDILVWAGCLLKLIYWRKGYSNGDIEMELEDNLSLCLNKQLNLQQCLPHNWPQPRSPSPCINCVYKGNLSEVETLLDTFLVTIFLFTTLDWNWAEEEFLVVGVRGDTGKMANEKAE